MTTDIHELDQYIGQYVSLDENGEGMAGFVVDVYDKVEYAPHPVRSVIMDYGYGFAVGAHTVITTPDPPEGEIAPSVENPVQLVHAVLDGKPCPNAGCVNRGRALLAVRAMRVWRLRQDDAYWKHEYVTRAYGCMDDPVSMGDVIREARHEGAPPHILETMKSIAELANRGRKG
jgi:hypothetical protein